MDNKAFISKLAKRVRREPAEVGTLIGGLCEALKEYGSELDSVAVPGVGTFKSVKKDEEIVVDSSTGKRTLIPPSISMSFQPSVVLRKKMMKK